MVDNGTYVDASLPIDIVNMYYNSSTSSVSVTTTNVTIVDALSGDDGAWFDYIVGDASTSARAGTVMAITINGVVQYIDTATADIGNTSLLTFDVVLSSSTLRLRASAASGTWYVTSAVRSNKF